MLTPDDCNLGLLDDALEKLDAASPQVSRMIVRAVAACVAADGTVTLEEGETLRAIAESLDCPAPPLLPGQFQAA